MKKFWLSFMAVALIGTSANAALFGSSKEGFSCTKSCAGGIKDCLTYKQCKEPKNRCETTGGLWTKFKDKFGKETRQNKVTEALRAFENTPDGKKCIGQVPSVSPLDAPVQKPSDLQQNIPNIERKTSIAPVRRSSTAVIPQVSQEVVPVIEEEIIAPVRRPSVVRRPSAVVQPPVMEEEVVVEEPIIERKASTPLVRRPSAVLRSSAAQPPVMEEEVVVEEPMIVGKGRPGPGAGGKAPVKNVYAVKSALPVEPIDVDQPMQVAPKKPGPGAGGKAPAKIVVGTVKQAQAPTAVLVPKQPAAKSGPSVPFSANQLAGVQLKKAPVVPNKPAPVSGPGGSFAQMNIPKIAGGETGEEWEQEAVEEPVVPVVKAVPQTRVRAPSVVQPKVEQKPLTPAQMQAVRKEEEEQGAALAKEMEKRRKAISGENDVDVGTEW